MKFSNGLCILLEPLAEYLVLALNTPLEKQIMETWDNFMLALKKSGKRGSGTYYPTDLKRLDIVLDCLHENGKLFSVQVEHGDIQNALLSLQELIFLEDYTEQIKEYLKAA